MYNPRFISPAHVSGPLGYGMPYAPYPQAQAKVAHSAGGPLVENAVYVLPSPVKVGSILVYAWVGNISKTGRIFTKMEPAAYLRVYNGAAGEVTTTAVNSPPVGLIPGHLYQMAPPNIVRNDLGPYTPPTNVIQHGPPSTPPTVNPGARSAGGPGPRVTRTRQAGGPPVDPRMSAGALHPDARFAFSQTNTSFGGQTPLGGVFGSPGGNYTPQKLQRSVGPNVLNSFGITAQSVPGIHRGNSRGF